MKRYPISLALLAGLPFALFQTGCGSSQNVYAEYLVGRVSFGSGVTAQPGAPIIIQYSSDNFATITGSTSIYNDQGLLTLPYRLDFDSKLTGDYVQIQAFQDINGNGAWAYGAGSGRFDRTGDGNAAYYSINRIVGVSCESGESSARTGCLETTNEIGGFFVKVLTLGLAEPDGSKDHYISGVDITLDSSTGL